MPNILAPISSRFVSTIVELTRLLRRTNVFACIASPFSVFMLVAFGLSLSFAQTRPARSRIHQASANQPKPSGRAQEVETLKTDTDLVTVPVIATERGGMYITDLRKEEFAISEDGVQQEIAFFGKVAAPFHVVLMLDTSSSTQDKLKQIQQAAGAFVEQLQPADRVKVISFDER